MWTTKKLKERFYSFFESRGHKILPSSSVIPSKDPTLLFTNSGMVQFKNIFLGDNSPYKRVCTSQRCIRAGGKHNDLDDVGKDNYHHTFFEMLGNWSFGDYFKEEAIRFAYEFLVEDLKLNKDNLYVTIYEEMDQESKHIWSKFVDPSRIIPSSKKDNFWEMGEFGPCGPCTEIHYDRIGNRDASSLVNKDDPNVIEIWNIVFMQFNSTPEGLIPLDIKHIDTGIGLERLLSILMNVDSNYKIDSFRDIINFVEEKCNFKFEDKNSKSDVAFRVIADHARTICVCLYDNVRFSSEGVGYVLRRILRRAVRYAHDVLDLKAGDLAKIVEFASKIMDLPISTGIVQEEEELFLKTLKKGLVHLDKLIAKNGILKAEDIFLLYDTFGFPKDLTELVAKEKSIEIQMNGFEELVLDAKEKSKGTKVIIDSNFNFAKTDDKMKYSHKEIEANVLAIIKNNEIVQAVSSGDKISVIFDRTCFYSECGGQVGDKGVIIFKDGDNTIGELDVFDTQSRRGFVFHEGILKGNISEKALLKYNEKLRSQTRLHHSTAHIFNHFIQKYIKTSQKGSLVDNEKCRFDFDGNKLSIEQLKALEKDMNEFVSKQAIVTVKYITKEEALKDTLLHLQPDEDYTNGVRLITMKSDSEEFVDPCGGTHINNSSEIRKIRIISETGIQANIRRIILVSGDKADEAEKNAAELYEQLKKGKVVNLDILLPLFDRNEIEEINKENTKKIAKETNEILKKNADGLKEQILNYKVQKMMKNSVFAFELENISELSKKEVLKGINSMGDLLKKESVTGFVHARVGKELLFTINTEDSNFVLEKLSESIKGLNPRIIKRFVQGNLLTNSEKDYYEKVDVLKQKIL